MTDVAGVSSAGASGGMRRDLISAYAAAAAKILSWVIVSAIVFRDDRRAFAMLALVRGTIGLLNYTALGLAPAMIHMLSLAMRPRPVVVEPVDETGLSYAIPHEASEAQKIYSSGVVLSLIGAVMAYVLTCVYALNIQTVHQIPSIFLNEMLLVVLWIGQGVILKLMSEPQSALLQASGKIAWDNWIVAATEAAWVVIVWLMYRYTWRDGLCAAAQGFVLAGWVLLVARVVVSRLMTDLRLLQWGAINPRVGLKLLGFGSLVCVAQLADFLYAPTDYILINRFLNAVDVANYAPAVQIDAALMLAVSGLAAVLLPKSAMAHAAGQIGRVRKYYIRGTLLSLGMLLAAGAAVWAMSPWIFRTWLGSDMPVTRAILPLILVHTVVGGSSGVARSVLLAIGKVRAFTVSVLIAGVCNVALSYVFAVKMGLGLRGIVLGTIAAVVGRCALWTPWYTLRILRKTGSSAGEADIMGVESVV